MAEEGEKGQGRGSHAPWPFPVPSGERKERQAWSRGFLNGGTEPLSKLGKVEGYFLGGV